MRSALAILALAGTASAQPLYGVDFGGSLYTINTATGAAALVGATGFDRLNGAAMNSAGDIFANRSRNPTAPTDPNRLIRINPATGAGTLLWDWGTLHDLRGLAFGDGDILYAIQDNGTADSLVTIDLATGIVTDIGPTGRSDLQGLTAAPGGLLYAVGINAPGSVLSINPATGTATLIGGAFAGDQQAIEFGGGTTLYAGRVNLRSFDLITGITTTIGPLGIADLRGMAGFRPTGGTTPCYANCDGSTTSPVLNVLDFSCYLNRFAAGESYANCDGSTTSPVLNVLDFSCFLNAFAAGCR